MGDCSRQMMQHTISAQNSAFTQREDREESVDGGLVYKLSGVQSSRQSKVFASCERC